MIYVSIENEHELSVKFYSQENFHELISICKRYQLTFNKYEKNDKKWYGQKAVFNYLINDLEKVEEIKYYPSKEKILSFIEIELETKRQFLRYYPKLLKAKPLGDYQVEGIKTLLKYNRYLNSDDCGLGKSYISISALNHYFHYGLVDRLLIVTLNQSITYNWKRELRLFSNFIQDIDNEVIIVDKNNRNIFESENLNQYKVIITDYNTIRLIYDYHSHRKLKKPVKNYVPINNWITKSNRCIICDECHAIKGFGSQTTKKLKLIVKNNFEYRYGLSATPAPNLVKLGPKKDSEWGTDIEEMFSLFDFLDPKVIGLDYQTFKNIHCKIGTRYSEYGIAYCYPKMYESFMQKVSPYIIKRLKKEVLPDLPNFTIKKVFLPFNKLQSEIYSRVIEEVIEKLVQEKEKITFRDIKNKFILTNLITSDVELLKKEDRIFSPGLNNLLQSWEFNNNSKLKTCTSLLKQHLKNGEKSIIWSFHPYTIDRLVEYHSEYNPISLHGKTKIKGDKGQFIDKLLYNFEHNPSIKLGVFNPICLGVGVNMKFCESNIFFDRVFDVKAYLQACGRSHRANSVLDVVIYNLIIDNSIECYLDRILDTKEILNDGLKDIKNLTINQICDIFTGRDVF